MPASRAISSILAFLNPTFPNTDSAARMMLTSFSFFFTNFIFKKLSLKSRYLLPRSGVNKLKIFEYFNYFLIFHVSIYNNRRANIATVCRPSVLIYTCFSKQRVEKMLKLVDYQKKSYICTRFRKTILSPLCHDTWCIQNTNLC